MFPAPLQPGGAGLAGSAVGRVDAGAVHGEEHQPGDVDAHPGGFAGAPDGTGADPDDEVGPAVGAATDLLLRLMGLGLLGKGAGHQPAHEGASTAAGNGGGQAGGPVTGIRGLGYGHGGQAAFDVGEPLVAVVLQGADAAEEGRALEAVGDRGEAVRAEADDDLAADVLGDDVGPGIGPGDRYLVRAEVQQDELVLRRSYGGREKVELLGAEKAAVKAVAGSL